MRAIAIRTGTACLLPTPQAGHRRTSHGCSALWATSRISQSPGPDSSSGPSSLFHIAEARTLTGKFRGSLLRRLLCRGLTLRLSRRLVSGRWGALQQLFIANQAGHMWRCFYLAANSIDQADADAIERLGSIAIQLYPRFCIRSHGRNHVRFRLYKIALCRKNDEII